MSARRALASVWMGRDDGKAWLVAETPAEVEAAVEAALNDGRTYAILTLANRDTDVEHKWNGRPLYVAASEVQAISPPLDDDDD
jgi:hypothetical protein